MDAKSETGKADRAGDALDVVRIEESIKKEVDAFGRKLYAKRLQAVADATPRVGTDGRPLGAGRVQKADVLTPYGTVRLDVFCGKCAGTGRFEVPFKERYCRGARFAATPLLERRIAATACETGSYEKCARLCGEWGCALSDDKARNTVTALGRGCLDSDLPALCADAAGAEDVLVVSMDGWMARFRGERWAEDGDCEDGRVAWHEVKSAVMYRLSQLADVSDGRRAIISKHIVCAPAGTSPEAFARMVEAEARRMGMLRARKVYFIMDGGTYLWNIFDVNFSVYATPTLDYWHAVQHLSALADGLFASEKDQEAKKEWLSLRCRELKAIGPSGLVKTLSEIDYGKIRKRDAKKEVRREAAYFKAHEEHMHYERNAALGVPIGSGAMESQCSQNQNRFKRRGQFWSEDGFAQAIKVYVRYTNGELDCCFRRRAA